MALGGDCIVIRLQAAWQGLYIDFTQLFALLCRNGPVVQMAALLRCTHSPTIMVDSLQLQFHVSEFGYRIGDVRDLYEMKSPV